MESVVGQCVIIMRLVETCMCDGCGVLTHLAGKMARRKSWRMPRARPTMLGPATSMSFTPNMPYSVCVFVGGGWNDVCEFLFNLTSVWIDPGQLPMGGHAPSRGSRRWRRRPREGRWGRSRGA